MKVAPGVSFTRLPHGGAVLVNGTTLALTECGEPEAAVIQHLLAHGLPDPEEAPFRLETGSPPGARPRPIPPAGTGGPPPAVLRGMAEQMIESGWLLDERRS
ncbi:actinodefensin-associated protein B [Spirillospora sp. NPDC050679]